MKLSIPKPRIKPLSPEMPSKRKLGQLVGEREQDKAPSDFFCLSVYLIFHPVFASQCVVTRGARIPSPRRLIHEEERKTARDRQRERGGGDLLKGAGKPKAGDRQVGRQTGRQTHTYTDTETDR